MKPIEIGNIVKAKNNYWIISSKIRNNGNIGGDSELWLEWGVSISDLYPVINIVNFVCGAVVMMMEFIARGVTLFLLDQ